MLQRSASQVQANLGVEKCQEELFTASLSSYKMALIVVSKLRNGVQISDPTPKQRHSGASPGEALRDDVRDGPLENG